jgi:hypothetical protein
MYSRRGVNFEKSINEDAILRSMGVLDGSDDDDEANVIDNDEEIQVTMRREKRV